MSRQNEHLNIKTNEFSLQIKMSKRFKFCWTFFLKFGVFHHLKRNIDHFVTTSHTKTNVKHTHEHNFYATQRFYATHPTTLYDSFWKHTVKNCKSDAKPWSRPSKIKIDDFFDEMRPPPGERRRAQALGRIRTAIWPSVSLDEYGLGRTGQPYIKTTPTPRAMMSPRRWSAMRVIRDHRWAEWTLGSQRRRRQFEAWTQRWQMIGAGMTMSEITFWD